jgi:hypothetical protein
MTSLWVKDQGVWHEIKGAPAALPGLGGWATIATPKTGSYTDSAGVKWDYWEFKADSQITLSKGGLLQVDAFGGGGGGGGLDNGNNGEDAGGGGGAGGYVSSVIVAKDAAVLDVIIGRGGRPAIDGGMGAGAQPGSQTVVGPVIAVGGGAGGFTDVYNSTTNGGRGRHQSSGNWAAHIASMLKAQQHQGSEWAGAAGAGAGGGAGKAAVDGFGGEGLLLNLNGTPTWYGGGGSQGRAGKPPHADDSGGYGRGGEATKNAPANRAGGGAGGNTAESIHPGYGGHGGSGIAFIRVEVA